MAIELRTSSINWPKWEQKEYKNDKKIEMSAKTFKSLLSSKFVVTVPDNRAENRLGDTKWGTFRVRHAKIAGVTLRNRYLIWHGPLVICTDGTIVDSHIDK